MSDDLLKCSHLYGNTSEVSQLFAHKERDWGRSVLCGCVSGKLREHNHSCISQQPKQDGTPQICLKPNKPCSCKQPMQGTKSLQYSATVGIIVNKRTTVVTATIWREYCSTNYRGHWIPIFHKLVWFLRITMKCQLHTSVKIPQCLYKTTFFTQSKTARGLWKRNCSRSSMFLVSYSVHGCYNSKRVS